MEFLIRSKEPFPNNFPLLSMVKGVTVSKSDGNSFYRDFDNNTCYFQKAILTFPKSCDILIEEGVISYDKVKNILTVHSYEEDLTFHRGSFTLCNSIPFNKEIITEGDKELSIEKACELSGIKYEKCGTGKLTKAAIKN